MSQYQKTQFISLSKLVENFIKKEYLWYYKLGRSILPVLNFLVTFLVRKSRLKTCVIIFFKDDSIPTVNLGIPNTEQGHCAKTMAILHHLRSKIKNMPEIKWIVVADDDTILGYCDFLYVAWILRFAERTTNGLFHVKFLVVDCLFGFCITICCLNLSIHLSKKFFFISKRQSQLETPVLQKAKSMLPVSNISLCSVSRMQQILTCYNSTKPVALGERYGYNVHNSRGYNYITGGGGMVFSRTLLEQLTEPGICECPSINAPDDMFLGLCIAGLGVSVTHSPLFHQVKQEYLCTTIIRNYRQDQLIMLLNIQKQEVQFRFINTG